MLPAAFSAPCLQPLHHVAFLVRLGVEPPVGRETPALPARARLPAVCSMRCDGVPTSHAAYPVQSSKSINKPERDPESIHAAIRSAYHTSATARIITAGRRKRSRTGDGALSSNEPSISIGDVFTSQLTNWSPESRARGVRTTAALAITEVALVVFGAGGGVLAALGAGLAALDVELVGWPGALAGSTFTPASSPSSGVECACEQRRRVASTASGGADFHASAMASALASLPPA
mmetsp:Transcript_8725/g.26818  ORF Transcript_8725/g.26818 Transcript_8725/m.26818 type:complete len:234 (+) Transcript_8725:852-1553(+)|eukprot:scaffold43759_cov28-Tisochrysis_lutea.AAC.1